MELPCCVQSIHVGSSGWKLLCPVTVSCCDTRLLINEVFLGRQLCGYGTTSLLLRLAVPSLSGTNMMTGANFVINFPVELLCLLRNNVLIYKIQNFQNYFSSYRVVIES